MFQTVNGVVRGADHPHIGTFHQLTGQKIGLCQLRIAFFPDGRGRFGAKAVINAEIAGKLQLRPIEKRTAQQVVHCLRIFQELVIVGSIAGAIPLRHPVGTHLPPLVVVTAQPELRHVVPTAVFRNLLRGEMAMVVDNRHLLRIFVVQAAGRLRHKQVVFMDKRLHGI